jgi:hypothetical protein
MIRRQYESSFESFIFRVNRFAFSIKSKKLFQKVLSNEAL